MKRFARRVTVAAVLAAAPLLTVASFASSASAAPAASDFSAGSVAQKPAAADSAAMEAEVVRLTNKERVAKGCPALRTDSRLTEAARRHSGDMVQQKFFSHTGSNGSNFVAREVSAGYPKKGASAENIAWGYRSPQQVVTGWMNSSGHRANILNCSSVAVGVGVAYTAAGAPYWTQDFGRV
ncbi:CAP domain-containing protein [Micromonosporaceae bacterium Da 78-11]